jgi:hypothetical protein
MEAPNDGFDIPIHGKAAVAMIQSRREISITPIFPV